MRVSWRRCALRGEVADAMLKTDRAFYVAERPYEDSPQVIGFDATISAPHMHAMALEALLPALRRPGPANVLDVGCGSGYFTAVRCDFGWIRRLLC